MVMLNLMTASTFQTGGFLITAPFLNLITLRKGTFTPSDRRVSISIKEEGLALISFRSIVLRREALSMVVSHWTVVPYGQASRD